MTSIRQLLTLAALLALAAPLGAQHRNKRSHRDSDGNRARVDTTVQVGHGATVELSVISGEIKVATWDRQEVRITAVSENADLRFNASSQRVSLSVEDDQGDDEDTRFDILVPKDAHVSASSISGEVVVRGGGEAEASSVSGDVTVSGVTGRTTLQNVSGELTATDLGGPVRAQSVSGDITLTGVNGDLNVQTVSGEMKLHGVKSSYVRTQTVSGDVEFDGSVDPKGRYEFHSHSGSFSVNMPRGAGATVSVRGFSGDLNSSCEMILQPGGAGDGHYKSMTFAINGGGAHFSFETFSGDVEIRGCGSAKSRED